MNTTSTTLAFAQGNVSSRPQPSASTASRGGSRNGGRSGSTSAAAAADSDTLSTWTGSRSELLSLQRQVQTYGACFMAMPLAQHARAPRWAMHHSCWHFSQSELSVIHIYAIGKPTLIQQVPLRWTRRPRSSLTPRSWQSSGRVQRRRNACPPRSARVSESSVPESDVLAQALQAPVTHSINSTACYLPGRQTHAPTLSDSPSHSGWEASNVATTYSPRASCCKQA